MESQIENPPGRRTRNLLTGLIVAAALLLIAIVLVILLFARSKRLNEQQAALEAETTSLTQEQQRLLEEKSGRDQRILNLQDEIQALSDAHAQALQERDRQITRLGRRVAEAGEMEKVLEQHEALRTDYDKLHKQYGQLLLEHEDLDSKHNQALASYKALKDSVNQSRELQAGNIFALTKWERWLWADRYYVNQARRIDETIVSFEINANPFAPEGMRKIHLNMVDPAGRILYASGESFQLAGSEEEIPYTKMQEIRYSGEPVKMQFALAHPENLEPGTYLFRVYIDGRLSGERQIRLE